MKAALLALLLSQDPVPEQATVLFAAEPPPATIIKANWRWQGEDHAVWILSPGQAKLNVARMEACEEELRAAQVEAAATGMPRWMWVTLGLAAGVSVGWFTAGVVR